MRTKFNFSLLTRLYSLNSNFKQTEEFLNTTNLLKKHSFINGERQPGLDKEFFVINPATGKRLTSVGTSSQSQIDECIAASHMAQKQWGVLAQHERSQIMRRAADLVRSRSNTIATVDVLDTGKAFWEAEADIKGCADTIDMFAAYAYANDGCHSVLPENNFYYTRKEPLGVCVGIGAWNFPFQMITWKSAPAIAAGNGFIFKPSPLTSLSAILLAEIYQEAGVPRGLVSVVQGGPVVGGYLTCHPEVAKVSFTGSVATGKKIMQSSVQTLKRLTLELGGKSPLIIFEDADLDDAVKGILLANFLTQGEVCSNGTRVFIHSSIYSKVEKRLMEVTKNLKVGDPFDPSVAIGAIISEAQFDIIMAYIDSAKKEGAEVLFGGTKVSFANDSYLSGGYFMTPCIVTKSSDEMTIVQEEVFGPVVALLQFGTEEEVIARANRSIYGLAGGVFTKQLNRAHRVAAQLECGSVYINTYNAYPPGMPFGGYKLSGIGRENCRETLDCYSQTKSVFVETNPLVYPFYNHH